ncbi:MAG: fructose-6-phosphate aldolase [Bacteroidetes bacterium RIFCSPLOWO2_02_FULL_36_8]|nr:MAG: fructose-6-phosphate aldolase [Bacteroidetes bacterium RIFCSPLOWO2_02_FULL_36_8]OFY69265.1 MAG: fructose-6-phosphate aldolase [Bacteroidetes bacterium RIFCSPLOWO2_12_FULL_37_12]
MYIIKIKGKAKIPDYVQIRDNDFVLLAYFRADRPLKSLEQYGMQGKEKWLEELIKNMPFGMLKRLDN